MESRIVKIRQLQIAYFHYTELYQVNSMGFLYISCHPSSELESHPGCCYKINYCFPIKIVAVSVLQRQI